MCSFPVLEHVAPISQCSWGYQPSIFPKSLDKGIHIYFLFVVAITLGLLFGRHVEHVRVFYCVILIDDFFLS